MNIATIMKGEQVMSVNKTNLTIRLDPQLYKKLTTGLANVGLTIEAYFTLAAQQFIIQGKVPFEIKSKSKVNNVRFNEQTRKIIVRASAEEEGIIPNTAKTFDNTTDAIMELFNDQ